MTLTLALTLPPASVLLQVLEGDASRPAQWWDGELFDAILHMHIHIHIYTHTHAGELFDAIILDVPCSSTGLLRTHPEVKLRQTEASVERLSQEQLQLLRTTWPLVRDGGELLYSTCSLLSDENEGVIERFMQGESQAESIRLALPLKKERDGSLMVRKAHGVLLLPAQRHQGGFAALLRKRP